MLSGNKQIISPRLSRWSVFLAAYNISALYIGLERPDQCQQLQPLSVSHYSPGPSPSGGVVFLIDEWEVPVTLADITKFSIRDQKLAQVLDWVCRGWLQGHLSEEFLPCKMRQHELSVLKGCFLWGSWIVVPPKLQTPILKCLHEGHPGIARMKALGHSYVWWPKLDQSIIDWVVGCQSCQHSCPLPPKSHLGNGRPLEALSLKFT